MRVTVSGGSSEWVIHGLTVHESNLRPLAHAGRQPINAKSCAAAATVGRHLVVSQLDLLFGGARFEVERPVPVSAKERVRVREYVKKRVREPGQRR